MELIDIHTHNKVVTENTIAVHNLFANESELTTIKSGQYFSIGIHPWHTTDIDIDKALLVIKEISVYKNVLAIGECGIDKNKGAKPETQIAIFEAQANLASELKMPLIIHCVKSFNEIITLHKKLKPTNSWIIHGFRQNATIAKQCIHEGLKLSFGKALLTNIDLQNTFKAIPNDSFFLETDEYGSIVDIYGRAAEIKQISVDELNALIRKNFLECFDG